MKYINHKNYAAISAAFSYHSDTGLLVKKTGQNIGKCVTLNSLTEKGYPLVVFGVNGIYSSQRYHRVVYCLCKGFWPTQDIDHIDGNKLNTKIENLREVTKSINNMSTHKKRGKCAGLPVGIYVLKQPRKDECIYGVSASYMGKRRKTYTKTLSKAVETRNRYVAELLSTPTV